MGYNQHKNKPIEWKEEPCRYPELGNCYICTSHSKSVEGYPYYRWNNAPYSRHMSHFIYEQMYGEIPAGMQVLHKCDTPECINPEHLWLGGNSDNVADRVKKGRTISKPNKGEKHGNSKLTEKDIIAIRNDSRKQCRIAETFNISKSVICEIKSRKAWAHV
jgi:hypothetical protein